MELEAKQAYYAWIEQKKSRPPGLRPQGPFNQSWDFAIQVELCAIAKCCSMQLNMPLV